MYVLTLNALLHSLTRREPRMTLALTTETTRSSGRIERVISNLYLFTESLDADAQSAHLPESKFLSSSSQRTMMMKKKSLESGRRRYLKSYSGMIIPARCAIHILQTVLSFTFALVSPEPKSLLRLAKSQPTLDHSLNAFPPLIMPISRCSTKPLQNASPLAVLGTTP